MVALDAQSLACTAACCSSLGSLFGVCQRCALCWEIRGERQGSAACLSMACLPWYMYACMLEVYMSHIEAKWKYAAMVP